MIDVERKEQREKLINDALDKAIALVEENCGCNHGERPWNEAIVRSKHNNDEYDVRLFVLDGSPPKGYITVDCAHGIVRSYGMDSKLLKSYKAFPDGSSLRAI